MLEDRIAEWRTYLERRPALYTTDVEELEDHLRSEVATLMEAGLDDDEAFLVAVKRLGDLDSISHEFAREYSERLWKQLVLPVAEGGSRRLADALMATCLAVAAAAVSRVPELFGMRLDGESSFYARNASLFVLPLLAGYFAWKRALRRATLWAVLAPFALGAVAINALPFEPGGHTEVLAALHLPMALWLAVGLAYVGGSWRSHARRMDFVRFSGEWFIYYTLIGLGGWVLIGFIFFIFGAIGLDMEQVVGSWVAPCGAAGAVLIAAWLVEAKQSVIENMAPVLTRLFTPLVTLVLLVFLVTIALTGSGIEVEREVLIGFDLLLVLVLGLVLYAISARDPLAPPGAFDILQLLLVVCALLVDALALWAIVARLSAFGFSPNRVAALGENLVLLVSLGGSAWLYARFVSGRGSFAELERWQTAYLPVYAVWAWTVVALFPPLFGYR